MFTADEAQKAFDAWGCNCGPSALAAVKNLTLDEARKLLPGFDLKRYTNPTMMRGALEMIQKQTGFSYEWRTRRIDTASGNATGIVLGFPAYGLARIQWTGPWTRPGVPPKVAYRHSHWVGSRAHATEIFDINAVSYCGGWIERSQWENSLVPWLLKELEPGADGWYITHAIEVQMPDPEDEVDEP